LKTLEEPPPDVKFVFATTEVHRVPVTVLSRCQRFSLRRVPIEQLVEHYRRVAEAEGITVAPAALALISRAADGSVRDGLSILDQAIALSSGGDAIEEAAVRDMLGIADRNLVFDLFETVLKGDAASAIAQMDALHQGGADPLMVLQDLLDLTHFVTRLKLAPEAGAGDPLEEGDRERGRPLAQVLSMPVLTRAWQMLLKGVEEVQQAPNPAQAATMVLVRLAYVADMPAPADLVRALANGDAVRPVAPAPAAPARPSGEPAGPAAAMRIGGAVSAVAAAIPAPETVPTAQAAAAPEYDPMPQSFGEVIELFDRRREALTRAHLWSHVHLVAFEPPRIEFRPTDGAPRDLASRVMQHLGEWTGTRWTVVISQAAGAPTLAEDEARRDSMLRSEVATHPLVRAVLDTFPGATIAAVRERFATDAGVDEDAIADVAGGAVSDDDSETNEDEA